MMRRGQKRKWIAVSLASAVAFTAIAGNAGADKMVAAEEAAENAVTIDAANLYHSNQGVFQGWGTSLCWFGNRIGGSEQTSNEAALLLCNEEEGLGLDIIRYNIGGGDDPTHDHITRTDSKMPGYWGSYDAATDTFTYDFTKDANQRNVLLKMLEQNPNLTLEAFSNSAPYFMTISGCTSGSAEAGLKNNLKEDKFDDFADYLATVVQHYKDTYNINFHSVEAMNENGWSIPSNGYKQEGCTFKRGTTQSTMLVELSKALENHGLSNLVVSGCDESNPAEAKAGLDSMTEEALNALEQVNVHTYTSTREPELRDLVISLNKNLWMSEYDDGNTKGEDPGEMGASLSLASRINFDMYNLQPSAWILWQAIGSYCDTEEYEGNKDPDSLSQKELDTNGFWGVTYADMNQEKVVLTKKYYTFGQFTKYINVGDFLIVGNEKNTVSYDDEKNELKIVAVNTAAADTEYKYNFSGFEVKNPEIEIIRTSGDMETGENWAKVEDENISVDSTGFTATLKGNSVTTFVIKNAEADMPEIIPSPAPTVAPTPAPTNPAPVVTTTPTETPAQEIAVEKVSAVKAGKVKKNSAVISWKKVDGAKYKVAYSINKKKLAKIKNGTAKAVAGTTVKNAGKNKITLKGLKKNKTYYVKVCAYVKKEDVTTYGKYSAMKKIKTKK